MKLKVDVGLDEWDQKGGWHLLDIEAENSCDVFVGRDSLMNHVCVENRVRAEDKAAENRINHVHGILKGKKLETIPAVPISV
jgi:hypothetical protein